MRLFRRKPREPRPGDTVRINGKLMTVVSITYPPGHTELEPLGERLARSIIVGDMLRPMRLDDALIDAGWSPPAHPGAQEEDR